MYSCLPNVFGHPRIPPLHFFLLIIVYFSCFILCFLNNNPKKTCKHTHSKPFKSNQPITKPHTDQLPPRIKQAYVRVFFFFFFGPMLKTIYFFFCILFWIWQHSLL
ncbi:hypothetical protein BY996DRAFT_8310297, partial [Phakopsora pachyrhizi]